MPAPTLPSGFFQHPIDRDLPADSALLPITQHFLNLTHTCTGLADKPLNKAAHLPLLEQPPHPAFPAFFVLYATCLMQPTTTATYCLQAAVGAVGRAAPIRGYPRHTPLAIPEKGPAYTLISISSSSRYHVAPTTHTFPILFQTLLAVLHHHSPKKICSRLIISFSHGKIRVCVGEQVSS